jgi:hypothetical protein
MSTSRPMRREMSATSVNLSGIRAPGASSTARSGSLSGYSSPRAKLPYAYTAQMSGNAAASTLHAVSKMRVRS